MAGLVCGSKTMSRIHFVVSDCQIERSGFCLVEGDGNKGLTGEHLMTVSLKTQGTHPKGAWNSSSLSKGKLVLFKLEELSRII